MPLAECHNQDKTRVPTGIRVSPTKSTTVKKVVQWKEEIAEEKIFEEYEDSERSESLLPSPTGSDRSTSSRDSVPPTELYSTRFSGLRRLPPSPHPLFRSEDLQNRGNDGRRVRAIVKVEQTTDRKSKMPATRFSTPLAVLDLAPPSATTPTSSARPSFSSFPLSSRPISASFSSSSALRRSTDTLDSRRSSSTSSSSMVSPQGSLSPLPTSPPTTVLAPSRFAVSGTLQGATRLEAGLEGVCALLNKTHAAQIRTLHVQTADPVLADIVANMQEHLRTEFATFAWPRALTDRAQEILRRISVLTLVVEITIEYVPEKEGLFRRFSHQIKSVFNFIRGFR